MGGMRGWRLPAGGLTIFTAVCALAAPSANAAPGPAPWAARHGLTSVQYQQEFNTFAGAGFRLTAISGYVVGGQVRYAALWRKLGGPAWVARHGLSSAGYQKAFDAYAKQGFRLVYVDGYEVKGKDRYAAIWEKRAGPPWLARHGLTGSQYQSYFKRATRRRYRLVHVSGYTRAGSPRYAAIFERSKGPAWVAHHGMTSAVYQKKYDEYVKKGFRLKTVSGLHSGGKDYYAALWEKRGGPVMRARHGIPLAAYQRTFDVDRYQGYAPVHLEGFSSGGSAKFDMVWESPFRKQDLDTLRDALDGFLSKQGVAGLSVAIAKDGRLLYASGFGLADKEKKGALDVHHRLRIGSVSKSITSVAIYRLIEEGKLSGIGRRVFGSTGVLSDVKVPSSMAALQRATIGNFLEHTSGLPGAGSGRGLPDAVHCASGDLSRRIEYGLEQHAQESADKGVNPLLGAPGEYYDYSNFGYTVLERVIEVVAQTPYEDYVRAQVFAPAGLTAPRLFRIGPYDPASGEAKHYSAGSSGGYAEYQPANTCENKPPGAGAGGWAMSAKDLLQYLTSVDGRPAREVLAPQSRSDMLTSTGPTKGPLSYYAKGWILNRWGWCGVGSAISQGHNGGVAGGFSNLFELPDGFAFAVIGNQSTPSSGTTMATGTCTAKTDSGGSISCGGTNMSACSDDSVGRLVPILTTIDWPDYDLF
jgi:CubicO group peptidase (beta-lactamase class C family)